MANVTRATVIRAHDLTKRAEILYFSGKLNPNLLVYMRRLERAIRSQRAHDLGYK